MSESWKILDRYEGEDGVPPWLYYTLIVIHGSIAGAVEAASGEMGVGRCE